MSYCMYLRKSRMEEQSDLAETLRRHKDTLYKIADDMGLCVGEVFEEVVSGESLHARPQMLALLDKVEAGGVDAVLCMDIDRLGRGGMRDQGIILDVFKESGTKIITPDHTYDLNDDSDEQLTEFKAFFSRQEYKQITKRLRRGLKDAINEGCYVANAPYGYSRVVKDKKPTLEIVEEEARFVRMMFDLYCDGKGCTTIARMVSAMGARPHRSDKFCRGSIFKILKNPSYIGKVVWNQKRHIKKGVNGNSKHVIIYHPPEKWTVVDGLHPAIISDEQFNLAQEIARSRYIPPSNDGTIKNPLAGIMRCGRCGLNLQRHNLRYDTAYLMCETPGCCAAVKFEYVEPLILEMLTDKLRELQADVPMVDEGDKYAAILDSLKRETAKTLKQKDRLHNLLEQGVYDVETYRERMQALTGKLNQLAAQERSAAAELAKHASPDREALAGHITNALDVYNGLDPAGRNKVLKAFIAHIKYYKVKKSKEQDFTLEIFYKHILTP